MKRREVELAPIAGWIALLSEPRGDEEEGGGAGSHSWMDCLAAELFLNS